MTADYETRVRRQFNRGVPTALYRHFDADGVLLYVGISIKPLTRLQGHIERSHWVDKIASITIERFPDYPTAQEAERRAICTENPLHNEQRARYTPTADELMAAVMTIGRRRP